MHNELRYQAKTHAISETPKKEKKNISASSPPNLFILMKNNKKHATKVNRES
jgi:hypothetical protein